MLRKTQFTTLCGIVILSGSAFAQVISTPNARDPATNRAPAPVTAANNMYNPSPDAQRAADELGAYLGTHYEELQPKLVALRFDRNGGPQEFGKLKGVLPSDMAAKVDAGLPILNARRREAQINVNLTSIGQALLAYAAASNDTFPLNLGQIVQRVSSVDVFVLPDTPIPNEASKGSAEEQSIWVQTHSAYVYLAGGKDAKKLSSQMIIAHERLDADLAKPTLAVLFADGRVQMMSRDKLVELLRTPGKPVTDA